MFQPTLIQALRILPLGLVAISGAQQGFPGGPGGPGRGPGPMGGQEIKVLKKFDADKNGYLDLNERTAARASLKQQGGGQGFPGGPEGRPGGFPGGPGGQGGPGGPGGRGGPGGGPGGRMTAGTPGPRVSEADVKPLTGKSLYDPTTLRTIFIQFEESDWEDALAEFHNTDVDVPATVTVDGVKHKNVGIRFRGMSSYMMVPKGNKRSFNLSVDMVDSKQRLLGYKTLNLLNSNTDASFMSSVLYSHIARKYLPAPKANHVKVVINGESWGIYANVEQFNNDFVVENYKEAQVPGKTGARWKVSGSPNGDGGLGYLGDSFAPYKQRYDMKSKENDADWAALVQLCKVLDTTPADQLEADLKPIFDIEGALRFLALDVALMNSDGYWIRSSDYNIYRDPKGVFHVIPHDMNEAFRAEGGPGGRRGPGGPGGGPGGFGGPPPNGQGFSPQGGFGGPPTTGMGNMAGGFELDPLVGLQDARKPLRSRLLAVPALKLRYLQIIKEIAQNDLDLQKMGPVIDSTKKLIDAEVKADTRKNSTYEAFLATTSLSAQAVNQAPQGRGPMGGGSLKSFFDQRRAYLLKYKPTQEGS